MMSDEYKCNLLTNWKLLFILPSKTLFMFLELSHTQKDVYKASKAFTLECYKMTTSFPQEERFAMTQQVRRAALSVHLNIAEGCSRKSAQERRRYYEVSRGSVVEIDAALDIAGELNYVTKENLKVLGEYMLSCFKQLSALIQNP
jgi:four helix bundle protein